LSASFWNCASLSKAANGVGLDVLANVATKLSRNSYGISMKSGDLGHDHLTSKNKKVDLLSASIQGSKKLYFFHLTASSIPV